MALAKVKSKLIRLRGPREELVGCCWLPRLVDKFRFSQKGTLPFFYRLALGSVLGVDGYFFRFFRLSKHAVSQAVLESNGDDWRVEHWFCSQAGVNSERIQSWNEYAVQLGSKGAPAWWTFRLVKRLLYPKAVNNPVSTIFEAIIQDEEIQD